MELPTALYSETTWNYHTQRAEYTHLTVCVVSEYCGRDEEKVDQKVRICFLTVKEKMIANCWVVKKGKVFDDEMILYPRESKEFYK